MNKKIRLFERAFVFVSSKWRGVTVLLQGLSYLCLQGLCATACASILNIGRPTPGYFSVLTIVGPCDLELLLLIGCQLPGSVSLLNETGFRKFKRIIAFAGFADFVAPCLPGFSLKLKSNCLLYLC